MENPETQTPKQKPKARSFTHAPEPTRLAAMRADAQDRKRTGLVALSIGASRMMRGRDGVRRQYQARELRVEAERAQRDGRELTVGIVCFECGKVYATEDDFKADHTLTTEQYRENAESHTYAYWCEDKSDPKSLETVAALSAEIKALENAHKDSVSKISQTQDVEAMIKERKRAEEIKGMLADARARKKSEDENIIGLMSETTSKAA